MVTNTGTDVSRAYYANDAETVADKPHPVPLGRPAGTCPDQGRHSDVTADAPATPHPTRCPPGWSPTPADDDAAR